MARPHNEAFRVFPHRYYLNSEELRISKNAISPDPFPSRKDDTQWTLKNEMIRHHPYNTLICTVPENYTCMFLHIRKPIKYSRYQVSRESQQTWAIFRGVIRSTANSFTANIIQKCTWYNTTNISNGDRDRAVNYTTLLNLSFDDLLHSAKLCNV